MKQRRWPAVTTPFLTSGWVAVVVLTAAGGLDEAQAARNSGAVWPAPPPLLQCDVPHQAKSEHSWAHQHLFPNQLRTRSGGEPDVFYDDLTRADAGQVDSDGVNVAVRQPDPHALELEAGVRVRYRLPAAPLGLALVARSHTHILSSLSAPADLQSGTLNTVSPATTRVFNGNGESLNEAGLTLRQAFFTDRNPLDLQAAFTARRQDRYRYDRTLGQTVLSRAGQYGFTGEQGFNLQAGLTSRVAGMDLALSASRLIPHGMDDAVGLYGWQTSAGLAATVDCGLPVTQLNLNWHARNGLDGLPDERFSVAGIAISGISFSRLQPNVHVGYKYDFIDTLKSMSSLGVGFSPWAWLNLDVSGTRTRQGAYGVMAKLGWQLP